MPYKDYAKTKECNARSRAKHRLVIRQRRRIAQAINKEFVYAYLLQHPCIDCNENDPIVLEFDHRNPAEKSYCISYMVSTLANLKALQKEISKCDVRCANCHRRKTALQLNWQKYPDQGPNGGGPNA